MGAVLTGFQNSNERMTVADEALKITTALGRTISGLWVGATNLPACRVDSCGPYNTFQWTDGDTTGTEGLKWGIGEPDNTNWPGSTACIQQFIMAPNYVGEPGDSAGWKRKFVHGDLDKYQCNSRVHPWTRLTFFFRKKVVNLGIPVFRNSEVRKIGNLELQKSSSWKIEIEIPRLGCSKVKRFQN